MSVVVKGRQRHGRPWAGTRAALLSLAARALPSGPEASPEQAGGRVRARLLRARPLRHFEPAATFHKVPMPHGRGAGVITR